MRISGGHRPTFFLWAMLSILCGCGEGAGALYEVLEDAQLPNATVTQRALEFRVEREYFNSLLQILPEQVESALGERSDGTVLFELDTSTLPLDLPGIALGPFGSGVGIRELRIATDLDLLEFTPIEDSEILAVRAEGSNIPIRIEHAVIFGDVQLAALNTNAACVIQTESPSFTTYVDMDIIVELAVDEEGELSPKVTIDELKISEFQIELIKDCEQPECSDQTSEEEACFECGICDANEFGAEFATQLQDILGGSFASIVAVAVEYIFNNTIAGTLPILGSAAVIRTSPSAIAWELSPQIGSALGKMQPIDLELDLSEKGLATNASALEISLDVGIRAPNDGCDMDRQTMEQAPDQAIQSWPEYAPNQSSELVPYDLALRMRPIWIERAIDEALRAGLGCSSVHGGDLSALLASPTPIEHGALQLFFPQQKFLGDPDHGILARVHAPPTDSPTIGIDIPTDLDGSLLLEASIQGMEILLSSNSSHGPTWLSAAPDIRAQIRVDISPEQNLEIRFQNILITGLEEALSPATQSSTSAALLGAIQEITANLENLPPITINISDILAGISDTSIGEAIGDFAPSPAVVGLQQRANSDLALFLTTDSSKIVGGSAASVEIPNREFPWLNWIFLGLCGAIFLFIYKNGNLSPPLEKKLGVMGLACIPILAFILGPGCETPYRAENCSEDADCVPGYFCSESEICTLRVTCTTHQDCCSGTVCSGGFCHEAPQCELYGCPVPGTYCSLGVCTTMECSNLNDSCAAGSRCTNGFCMSESFELPCPEGSVLDPRGLRCVNLPNSCTGMTCPAGQMLSMTGGPHFGMACIQSLIPCECTEIPGPANPNPDGSIQVLDDGRILWYDARYGDLVLSDPISSSQQGSFQPNEVAGLVLAGLPEEDSPAQDIKNWRAGLSNPGPDIGRDLSALAVDGNHVLIAARSEPEDSLFALGLNRLNLESSQLNLPDTGKLLGAPEVFLDPNDIPCIAVTTQEETQRHAITRVCALGDPVRGLWESRGSILLNTISEKLETCPHTPCLDGRVCAADDSHNAICITKGNDCPEDCEAHEVCGSQGTCMGRIAKQDANSIAPYPLSISSGPEFVTAVTSEMNPSTLVGFRWNENNAFRRPFFQLQPSGARDVLDISTHRTEDTVWIVVATAQHPGILLFQWEDGLDFPEPTAVQPAPIPGSPRSVPRTILPYDVTQGSKRWLVRADPSNDVWLLSLDTLGNASWTRTLDMPVAGLSISAKGEIFAWVIRDGKTQMERWLLSGTQL